MSIKFKSDIDTGSNWILNHPSTPTTSSHLTSKNYVDTAYSGIEFISVTSRVVSLTPITGNIGNEVSTVFNVTVPNQNVICQLYSNSTNQPPVLSLYTLTVSGTTATFTFTLPPSTNQYRYVII